jgi:hypothetical protein
MIPKDSAIGNGYTFYGSFGRWCRDGVGKRLMDILHRWNATSGTSPGTGADRGDGYHRGQYR